MVARRINVCAAGAVGSLVRQMSSQSTSSLIRPFWSFNGQKLIVPSHRHSSEAKRRQKDVDASWTKKHGKSYFGYKISVDVDKRYKLIRKVVTDTASTHDSQHFDAVLSIAKSRARVDHVFGALSPMGSTLIRTIGQPRANFALVMRALCYNMKRFGYLQRAGIEVF